MFLGPIISRDFDVQAEQGIGHQGRLADSEKQADVGHRKKSPARIPRAIKRLGQQPLLLFRVRIVHESIVLCDQIIDTGYEFRRQLCRDGLSGIRRIHSSHQWAPI